MKRLGVITVAALALLTSSVLSGSADAARLSGGNGPPPRSTGQVKYWIDKSNVEKYKDQMPAGLYVMVKEWNRRVPVYDTVHDYKFPDEYLEATEKHKGTARVNSRGGLENYAAGLPFPDPKSGAEAMYNYDYKYNGDDFKFFSYIFLSISSAGKVNKIGGAYWRLAYQGRLYCDPTPTIPNKDGVVLKEISALTYPEDVAGLALLTVRYQNPDKLDDGWMYIPTIRRVRRISVAQRGDTFGGSDLTWDDYRGFSGKVSDYTWKLVGKMDMLVPYHQNVVIPRVKDKMWVPEDDRYELRPVVVVEGVNKAKDYVYSKRRIYIDTDSWGISVFEMYDRQGKLWKYGEYALAFDPRNHNAFGERMYVADLIGRRATALTQDPDVIKRNGPIQLLNLDLKESVFTPTWIQSWSR